MTGLEIFLCTALVASWLIGAVAADRRAAERYEAAALLDGALNLLGATIMEGQSRETAFISASALQAWFDSDLHAHVDLTSEGVVITISGPEPAESERP